MNFKAIQSLQKVVEGMKIEKKLFLGLGVPESDQGVDIVIFG